MASARGAAVRASAFLRKDLVETVRQPRLFAALVLAPFLVLLVFGAGLRETDPIVNTVFVVPDDDALSEEVERFAAEPAWRLRVQAITSDVHDALPRLERGEIDLVVAFPENAAQTVRANQRVNVVLYHNLVDPVESNMLGLATRAAIDRLNRQVVRSWVAQGQLQAAEARPQLERAQERVAELRRAVEEGDRAAALADLGQLQADVVALSLLVPAAGVLEGSELAGEPLGGEPVGEALASLSQGLDQVAGEADTTLAEVDRLARDLDRLDRALADFRGLHPAVVVTPFQGTLERLATVPISLSDFFAPAVVVLLLQHMLVTLVGLSVVRDEALGTNELLRVSPLTAGEVLLGKYLAALILGALVATILLVLLVVGLGVPLAGPLPVLVASVAALLFTSVGMGFLVALLARNDSQAVQYAMMVLLASIFLTGFLISLDRLLPGLQVLAWMLPPTYGITLLRNVMLRGTALEPLLLLGLTGIGVVLAGLSWLLLRRRLDPPRARRSRPTPPETAPREDPDPLTVADEATWTSR